MCFLISPISTFTKFNIKFLINHFDIGHPGLQRTAILLIIFDENLTDKQQIY